MSLAAYHLPTPRVKEQNWWRRRGSNPRLWLAGQHIHMLLPFLISHARQANWTLRPICSKVCCRTTPTVLGVHTSLLHSLACLSRSQTDKRSRLYREFDFFRYRKKLIRIVLDGLRLRQECVDVDLIAFST